MFGKKCASEIREARKMGRRCNKRPATDLRERASKQAKSNLPEMRNTTFMVVICWVSNGNDIVLSPNQLQAAYTNVRHWEELIDLINNTGCPTEPYIPISKFKCTLEQAEFDEEYMELYTNEQMMTDPT